MSSQDSRFGSLVKGYLFFLGQTQTALSAEIGLSLNKLSAAMKGRYRLKKDHFDRLVTALEGWGLDLTADDNARLLAEWRAHVPADSALSDGLPTRAPYVGTPWPGEPWEPPEERLRREGVIDDDTADFRAMWRRGVAACWRELCPEREAVIDDDTADFRAMWRRGAAACWRELYPEVTGLDLDRLP